MLFRSVRIKWIDALKAVCVPDFYANMDVELANKQTLAQWYARAVVWAWANEKGMDNIAMLDDVVAEKIAAADTEMTRLALMSDEPPNDSMKKLQGEKLAKLKMQQAAYDATGTALAIKTWARDQKLLVDGKTNAARDLITGALLGKLRTDDFGPVHIVLARPFIEHRMHSAIVAVSGADTGRTLFGPADMQLSANTQVKVIEGHYTGHFKSVITKPENVYIARDVCCAGYSAGANTLFFAAAHDDEGVLSYAATNVRSKDRKSTRLNSSH